MEKFKERKIGRNKKIFIILSIILILLVACPIVVLEKTNALDNKVSIKLLNSLAENKTLTTSKFIKEDCLKDYDKLIYNKLIDKYPDALVKDLLNSENKYYFGEKELLITYNVNKVLNTTRDFYLLIPYSEISKYITFKYNKKSKETISVRDEEPSMTISITYDDGPNGERTSKVLALLKDYNYSSTFFLVGNKMEEQKDTVLNIYNSTSEVGYHSYAHKYLTKQTTEEITSEYNTSDQIFNSLTGDHLKLTRPPYGSYNEKVMNAIPTPFIRWNLDTNDWRIKDPNELANYVLDNAKDGDIVLFHDSYDTSIEASEILYKELYLRNINVVSVSKLASIKGITLENNNAYYHFN